MALAHCPECDLWLTERQSCLHIGPSGSQTKGSPAAVSTDAVASFRGLGVSTLPSQAGSADFYSSDDAGGDCPDGFATPASFGPFHSTASSPRGH